MAAPGPAQSAAQACQHHALLPNQGAVPLTDAEGVVVEHLGAVGDQGGLKACA